jgi:hypothetical protein
MHYAQQDMPLSDHLLIEGGTEKTSNHTELRFDIQVQAFESYSHHLQMAIAENHVMPLSSS